MIGIIGAGSMGMAIARRLNQKVLLSDIDPLKIPLGKTKNISRAIDNIDLTKRSNVIILAVKPQHIVEVIKEISPFLSRDKLIISIAAGIETGLIKAILEKKARVIRIMPNMPAMVGKGISAIAKGKFAGEKDLAVARKIFSKLGEVVEVEEGLLDTITALSGSGPAYYFLLTDVLEKIACSYGLKKEIARQLAVGTFIGSSACAEASDISMRDFIKKVASKGGITEAALKVFKKKGFDRIIKSAVSSAVKKGRYLKKGLYKE